LSWLGRLRSQESHSYGSVNSLSAVGPFASAGRIVHAFLPTSHPTTSHGLNHLAARIASVFVSRSKIKCLSDARNAVILRLAAAAHKASTTAILLPQRCCGFFKTSWRCRKRVAIKLNSLLACHRHYTHNPVGRCPKAFRGRSWCKHLFTNSYLLKTVAGML
jgi:hypothetical protein